VTEGPFGLRYLPLFEEDLATTVDYLSTVLRNPRAASTLVDNLEKAILRRQADPLGFAPYPSTKDRRPPYYALHVGNHIAFYVIIGNVMEFRRFLYSRRDLPSLL